jgi:hypothetical protein
MKNPAPVYSKTLKLNNMVGSYKEEKNKGSALLLYTLGNVVLGIAGLGEGISDLVVGTISDLFGEDAYAKYVYNKSTVGEWKKSLDVFCSALSRNG